MDAQYELHCNNRYHRIEHGTEESWKRLLNTSKGVWIVERVADQLQINRYMGNGVLGWELVYKTSDYAVIDMPKDITSYTTRYEKHYVRK